MIILIACLSMPIAYVNTAAISLSVEEIDSASFVSASDESHDFERGVYTFLVPEGKTGTLTVNDKDGAVLYTKELRGEASYAVFLPKDSVLTHDETVTQSDEIVDCDLWHQFKPGGSLRVYATKDILAGEFLVTVAPGKDAGYLLITSNDLGEGKDYPSERIDLIPGIVARPGLERGQFMEIVDCVLTPTPAREYNR